MSILKIAHRGASGIAPENTLLALRKGFESGADGIECDVHLCKSGEPVIFHDTTLKRTTGARGKITDQTLTQLRKLDAGRGERIPTLEEYLEALGGKTIFIELKTADTALPVAKMVTRFAEKKKLRYPQMVVISFLWNALLEVKKTNPDILLGASPKGRRMPANFMARAQEAGMWSVNPCIDILTQRMVDDAHERGLKVITWTANRATQIAKARKLGVDGIMSDWPDKL